MIVWSKKRRFVEFTDSMIKSPPLPIFAFAPSHIASLSDTGAFTITPPKQSNEELTFEVIRSELK